VETLIDRLAGTHLCKREAIARQLAQVRAELAGQNPPGTEAVLVERAVVCWLAACEADLVCLRAEASGIDSVVEYYERRRDRAHRRFLSAVRALAVVHRLAVPVRRPHIDFGGRLAGAVAVSRN
jgi:hypothetical protein